ncbi:MAG: hypothetical protein ABI461_18950 [Polyangiaceae bacterium]
MSRFLIARVGALVLMIAAASSCTTLKNSAAKDPQKCEQDPKCNHRSDKSQDCITACVDNYDCIQRCDQVNEPNRGL